MFSLVIDSHVFCRPSHVMTKRFFEPEIHYVEEVFYSFMARSKSDATELACQQ